jgi:hypothetical protein
MHITNCEKRKCCSDNDLRRFCTLTIVVIFNWITLQATPGKGELVKRMEEIASVRAALTPVCTFTVKFSSQGSTDCRVGKVRSNVKVDHLPYHTQVTRSPRTARTHLPPARTAGYIVHPRDVCLPCPPQCGPAAIHTLPSRKKDACLAWQGAVERVAVPLSTRGVGAMTPLSQNISIFHKGLEYQ